MVSLGIVPLMPLTGDITKLNPLQVTVDKLFIAGKEDVNINPDNAAVPPSAVSPNAPVVPLPTTAVMVVEERTWNDVTAVPPRVMDVVPMRLVPVIVIVFPVDALVGV